MKKSLLLPSLTLFFLAACTHSTDTTAHTLRDAVVKTIGKNSNTKNKPAMKGFKTNIEKETLENENFRKVVYSAEHLQLVLMTLKVGEDIAKKPILLLINFFVLKVEMERLLSMGMSTLFRPVTLS